MKNWFQIALVFGLTTGLYFSVAGQDAKLSEDFKEQTIERLNELMIKHYVFPEVAQKTADHLKQLRKKGHFDQIETLEAFAKSLTEEVQAINKDKHMRIRPVPPHRGEPETAAERIEAQLHQLARMREMTAGFNTARKLEGNVGYLDLRGFAPVSDGATIADSYMKLLATSDAIIIDLRKNGGGSPAMVQYLCSYFFDEHVHLNSLYWREGDRTEEFWTLEKVGGQRMPDVPLFVLTSKRTFSGAEEFAYNMQTQKRATLIGETTGGGANPGGTRPINEKLMVFIPGGRAINPITKTNWESVGVVPEIKVSSEEALDKAHEMAKDAAREYRETLAAKHRILLTDLMQSLDGYVENSSAENIIQAFKQCQLANLLEEHHINSLGYEFLMAKGKPHTAEVIFKTNTVLYPNSANVYDSYGEALAANGKMKASLHNYKKAVETAKANDDPQLDMFVRNLEKIETNIKKQ